MTLHSFLIILNGVSRVIIKDFSEKELYNGMYSAIIHGDSMYNTEWNKSSVSEIHVDGDTMTIYIIENKK